MAKRIDITNIARRTITGEDVEPKLSKHDYGRLLQLMARWTRSAHARAMRAEELLHGQPVWKKRFDDQKRVTEQLARERNAAEAKVEALKTEHREALMAAHDKLSAYEEELVRWREESEKQFDGLNHQLNDKEGEIATLIASLNAAIIARNRYADLSMVLKDSAQAEVLAVQADITLAELGLRFTKLEDVQD